MTLGDAIGRLSDPPAQDRFETYRLSMVDQLVAAEAKHPVSHAVWNGAFETAVGGIESQLVADARAVVNAAAARSRYPSRLLQAALPTPTRAEALRHRLLAAGMPLERLETLADDDMSQRQRGVALETAWEGVLRVAREETDYWNSLSANIMVWRRPTTWLWIATVVLLVVTTIIAGWLGGQIDSPDWFEPIAKFWWGLPWW